MTEPRDPMQDAGEYDNKYMHGAENRAIRYYYYLNSGLGILNQFRNLGLGIFALYFTLHLTNPLIIVAMLVPSIVGLTVLGYYNVHTINKVTEWIGMRFASHYAIRQFNYNAGQYELLKDIKEGLKSEREDAPASIAKKEV